MGNASKVLKSFHMAPKEAFLPLSGKHHREGSARKAQPHNEKLHFLAFPVDDSHRFPPIHLSILAGIIFQRQKDIGSVRGELVTGNMHANGCFTARKSFFANDLEDPMGSISLFSWESFVLLQKKLNALFVRAKDGIWLLTWGRLGKWRIVGKSFSDGATVAFFFSRKLMDALLFDVISPSNPFPI